MESHLRLAFRLVEMIMAIEMKVFGKANVQVSCMKSMSRLFYTLLIKLFSFPNPNPKVLTLKNIAAFFSPLCFCMQPLLLLLSSVALRMRLHNIAFSCFTAE